MPRDTYDGGPSDELGFPSSLVVVVAVVRVATGLLVVVVRVSTELVTMVGVLMGLATVVGVSVRATLPPSTLFADRALLCRGYSISEPNALVETVSKYKGLH